MKALLVAINAQFVHTNLAVRLLRRASGGRADLLELNINLPRRRMLHDIARRGPDLVAFSCYIWNIGHALALAQSLKAALPGVRVALGGPEVSFDGAARLAAHPAIDFILAGEGELSFPALLDALPGGALGGVPGLIWREGGAIVDNGRPPLLPPDRWIEPYERLDGLEGRILYAETARGCPYRCGYCLSGGDAPVRALPADAAAARLIGMAEGGATLIKLVDRTFNFDRRRADAIWAALIEHSRRTGLSPTYHFEIAGDLIDERAIGVLSAAPNGLFQFEAGIQSATPAALRAVGRSADVKKVAAGIAALVALGNASVHVDLIAGLPGEDL
ncbi:MAG: B12-binding domain-containing radical SAM protein, partial [Clostridiales bacterium]|nr:B12-binding domain-containing radical SAM protein [Clostridiales bacterium]